MLSAGDKITDTLYKKVQKNKIRLNPPKRIKKG